MSQTNVFKTAIITLFVVFYAPVGHTSETDVTPRSFLHSLIAQRLEDVENKYLVQMLLLKPETCQVVESATGRQVANFKGIVDCVIFQILDQIATGKQSFDIYSTIKFLRSPEQKSVLTHFRWRPILLPDYIDTGVPSTSIPVFVTRVLMALKSWQNTDLQIEFPDNAVPIEWIMDGARPGFLPSSSITILAENFGSSANKGIKKIDLEIVTQQPGEEAGGVCSEMTALPSTIRRMCAQFRVYGEDLLQPGIYAVLEYGYRQSPAQVEENYQRLKKQTDDIVKNHGKHLFWPPPTEKQMHEMANNMTPAVFDAEFRLNPKSEITWSDLGIDKLN